MFSKNSKLKNNKFYNYQHGISNDGYIFILPTITISKSQIINWDTKMYSCFFGFAKFYFQINIFESIKNSNTEVFKEDMVNLLSFLKNNKLTIKDIPTALDFLNKNIYLISIIKNSDLSHPYTKEILVHTFKDLDFIENLNKK